MVDSKAMAESPYTIGLFRKLAQRFLVLGLLFFIAGCINTKTGDLPLADVDMNRMYGGWYIIATVSNFFERKMVEPYDVYSRRPDGDISEDFYFRSGSFNAGCHHLTVHDWIRPGTHNAVWRVQLFWPIDVPFLVAYVDPDYRFVIFGENNRRLGWIYARSPTIDDADYASLRIRLLALGYDPDKFQRFLQHPGQFGSPGFWSAGVEPPLDPPGRCAP